VRSRLKFVATAVLGLLLIYVFARDLEWAAVWEAVRGADWGYLVASVALILVSFLVRALRWRTLLAPIHPTVSVWNLLAATSIGFAALFFFGRPGEILRPVTLSSMEHIRPSASFATILIERIFDSTTLVLIFAVNLLFFDRPLVGGMSLGPIRWAGGLLMIGCAAGIVFLVLLRRHRLATLGFLDRNTARFGTRVRRMTVSVVGNFAEALSVLHDARELVAATAWSALLWAIFVLNNLLIIWAFGIDATLGDSIFVMGFAMVGSLVPTPGGSAGAFHAATAKGLVVLGIEPNLAAAVSIVVHLVGFGTALIPGLFFLMRGGISVKGLRAALHEDLNSQADFQAVATRP
jgi:glycosyltransferase 2 family protein